MLYGIAYGNGTFVVVGENGTILTSPDGVTWTIRTSGISTPWLMGITYGNDTFVAVGCCATILTSNEGVTWKQRISGTSSGLYAVTYGNDTFVVVGSNGISLTILQSDPITSEIKPTINLPQTGQTKCYNSLGAEIDCAGTGQDGEIRAGVEWPNPRFTVIYCNATGPCADQNSDCDDDPSTDVITDNLTGLMWARDGNLPGNTKSWLRALEFVALLNSNGGLCGYSDWRLSNINELESLINADKTDNAVWLNNQGFTNVQSNFYYSSTTGADGPDSAWRISMWDSYLGGLGKINDIFLFPVRSGQIDNPDPQYPANLWKTGQTISFASGDDGNLERGVSWPNPRFTDNGDGTVTDNLTGLMWTKDANAPGPNSCSAATSKTWQGALHYVACLNTNQFLGYSDWRLPNKNEFFSLVDRSRYYPALPSGHPFLNVQFLNLQPSFYWSSTTSAFKTESAWCFLLSDGTMNINFGDKLRNLYVWPVRAGTILEYISTPETPSRPTSGVIGVSYTYSTGGSTSNLGHSVQYFFDWGDGTNSGWLPVSTTSASKTWTTAGTYSVKSQARCATDTSVVSSWSGILTVTISAPTETISTPNISSGPTSGTTGTSYTYSTGGSSSNLGHPIEYRFDWGDGAYSSWSSSASSVKSWSSAGTYPVRSQARCGTHNSIVSGWTSGLSVTISGLTETVSTPNPPSGPASGIIGISYFYSTGGATSNLGHLLEYEFDWKGDGTDLSSWGSATQSKSWTLPGTYTVKARARCATHTSVMSGWSTGLLVTISTGVYTATRDLPDCYTPSVPLSVTITVTPSATTNNYGVVETVPNGWTVSDINENGWWDNEFYNWVRWYFRDKNNHTLTYKATPPFGETGSKTFLGWAIFGEDVVTIGGDSTIEKCPPETVSIPNVPSGPTSGSSGISYSYTTGGSTSNLGHSLEYQFDWKGDGTDLSPWGSATQSKIWTSAGTYNVRARARCATDTSVVSGWSSGLSVTIVGGGIATRDLPDCYISFPYQ